MLENCKSIESITIFLFSDTSKRFIYTRKFHVNTTINHFHFPPKLLTPNVPGRNIPIILYCKTNKRSEIWTKTINFEDKCNNPFSLLARLYDLNHLLIKLNRKNMKLREEEEEEGYPLSPRIMTFNNMRRRDAMDQELCFTFTRNEMKIFLLGEKICVWKCLV